MGKAKCILECGPEDAEEWFLERYFDQYYRTVKVSKAQIEFEIIHKYSDRHYVCRARWSAGSPFSRIIWDREVIYESLVARHDGSVVTVCRSLEPGMPHYRKLSKGCVRLTLDCSGYVCTPITDDPEMEGWCSLHFICQLNLGGASQYVPSFLWKMLDEGVYQVVA